jgi:hypothetical protein
MTPHYRGAHGAANPVPDSASTSPPTPVACAVVAGHPASSRSCCNDLR